MLLSELLADIEYENIGNIDGLVVSGISRDTRNAQNSDLFVAIDGTNYGSADIIELALKKGVTAIVAEKVVSASTGVPVILVKSARKAFAELCSVFYGNAHKDIIFFGITGTNGKTSTSYFLRSVLLAAGYKTALIGTTGVIYDGKIQHFPPESSGISQMTTPDPEILYPLLSKLKNDGVTHVVMEVSSHALQLEKLAPIRFKCAVFTNLSPEHLDFHGSLEEYKKAKLTLCEMSELCVYNCDDAVWQNEFKSKDNCYSYGVEKGVVRGCDVKDMGLLGIRYILKSTDNRFCVTSAIPGRFTVYNTLAASAAALMCGISPEAVCYCLRAVEHIPGRLEKIRIDEAGVDFSVYIDYAHTAEAMERLLTDSAFADRQGRLITLFGCGGERDRSKRAPMGRIAAEYSDFVYITSDNSRGEDPYDIISDILEGVKDKNNYKVIIDREEAITDAFFNCKSGDILLLVGKGHEDYEVNKKGRIRFSEREILWKAAERIKAEKRERK